MESCSYLPGNLDIRSARAVIGCNSVDDTYNIALHHAHVFRVAITVGQVQEVLDEVHNIGARVHAVLFCSMSQTG